MLASARTSRTGRTRAALIAAGLDLLVERPIEGIAIDELVARAGVAKGSFFNHFADKHAFAAAVAGEVRAELEAEIARANDARADPVARMAWGMSVAADFARRKPDRARVLLRHQSTAARADDPLNRGLKDDLDAARVARLLRPEAVASGLPYWLGLCQVVMIIMVETQPSRAEAKVRLGELLAMGLAGLGIAEAHAAAVTVEVLAGWED